MTGLQARQRSRELFPQWPRSMRAKWVVARLKCSPIPKTPMSRLSALRPESVRVYSK